MAEILNTYFSSVFTDEDVNNVPKERDWPGQNLEDIQVTDQKIKEKLRKIKSGSAPGPDGIGAMLLQQLADKVA
jgi:hypothetical protein